MAEYTGEVIYEKPQGRATPKVNPALVTALVPPAVAPVGAAPNISLSPQDQRTFNLAQKNRLAAETLKREEEQRKEANPMASLSEGERKAATLLQRLQISQQQLNDVLKTKNINYLHIAYTSKIEFVSPYIPTAGSKLTIVYYKSKNSRIVGTSGTIFSFVREEFQFTGSGSFFDPPTNNRPMFNTNETINSVVTVEINGLAEQQGIGFIVSDDNSYIILSDRPSINSNISVGYLF